MAWPHTEGCCASPALKRIARQTSRIMEIEEACVVIHEGDELRSNLAMAEHRAAPPGRSPRRCVDHGMVAQVMATGEPMTLTDYRQLFWPLRQDPSDGAHAGGATPIRWGGRVRGVLAVASSNPARTFGRRQLETLGDVSELAALALQCSEVTERLESTLEAGVEMLASAVNMRDSRTARHSEHVVGLGLMVGETLGLQREELRDLEIAARLHDVGKIGVPDFVLQKPGALNAQEWRVMRRHPVSGAEMLRRVPGLEGVAAIVRHHHERYDGTGYPLGLRGDEIPVASRVISTCDAYDAMLSDRPYRPAMSHEVAVEELRALAGAQFDPDAVDALIGVVPEWRERVLEIA